MSNHKATGNPAWKKGMASPNPMGRMPRVVEDKYIKKLHSTTKISDWVAICSKAIEQAKDGDDKARRWISEYLIGKPLQGLDLTSKGEKIQQGVIDVKQLSTDQLRRLSDIVGEVEATEQSGNQE